MNKNSKFIDVVAKVCLIIFLVIVVIAAALSLYGLYRLVSQ